MSTIPPLPRWERAGVRVPVETNNAPLCHRRFSPLIPFSQRLSVQPNSE